MRTGGGPRSPPRAAQAQGTVLPSSLWRTQQEGFEHFQAASMGVGQIHTSPPAPPATAGCPCMCPVGIFSIIFPLNLINPRSVMTLEISIKHTVADRHRPGGGGGFLRLCRGMAVSLSLGPAGRRVCPRACAASQATDSGLVSAVPSGGTTPRLERASDRRFHQSGTDFGATASGLDKPESPECLTGTVTAPSPETTNSSGSGVPRAPCP